MDGDNIAMLVLLGSRNINRMRNEINQIVKILHEFAIEMPISESGDPTILFSAESQSCRWTVSRIVGNKRASALNFECMRKYSGGDAYVTSWKSPVALEHVQFVYCIALPVLAQKALETFPGLAQTWQHLINASKVTFKD